MKKYTKPAIGFESFFLSSTVVNTCEITQLDDERLEVPPFGYLFTGKESCGFKLEEWGWGDGSYNKICYHNPTTELNLFNS